MAFEENKSCLWHAFNSLDDKQQGTVIKSKLKVLTQNIGSHVGVSDVEKNLQDYCETDSISFLDYLNYLKIELFNNLPLNDRKEQNSNLDVSKVNEVCWILCSNKYLTRSEKLLDSDDVSRLWRLFNFLAETDSGGEMIYPVVIHMDEMVLLIGKIISLTGHIFDEDTIIEACEKTQEFSFKDFLELSETKFLVDKDSEIVSSAIKAAFDEYIEEVVKKDYLQKKSPKLNTWRERWFMLTRTSIKYFASRAQQELKGEVTITPNCKVQVVQDKTGLGSRQNRFQLVSDGRTFELSAPDAKTRVEWVAALKNCIDQCLNPYSPQKVQCLKRRTTRQEKMQREREEEARRKQEQEAMERTKQELMAEKMARSQLQLDMIEEVSRRDEELERLRELDREREQLLQKLEFESSQRVVDKQKLEQLQEELSYVNQKRLEEAAIHEAEQRRLRELQGMKKELQALLEEERQAKRDEEIVRTLQSKMLEEEFSRREELEQLQKQMESTLQEERQKREGLEQEKSEQELQILQERDRLQALEKQRHSMDVKLQEAFMKLQETERAKEKMEQKLKEKQKEQLLRSVASHRGLGAFTDSEWKAKIRRSKSVDTGMTGGPHVRKVEVEEKIQEENGGNGETKEEKEGGKDGEGVKEQNKVVVVNEDVHVGEQ